MKKRIYTSILGLAIFTIAFNILEGMVSVWFGIKDETLALFGFGMDSFIEVISGVGILVMVLRFTSNPDIKGSTFERMALRITGGGFYLLTIGLIAGAVLNLYHDHKPETTLGGIIISGISIITMLWLYRAKLSLGKKAGSEPVIADAKCSLVCIYMSLVLLASSLVYKFTGFGWTDTLGAVGLAWFSYSEGKEAFEKAEGKECGSAIPLKE